MEKESIKKKEIHKRSDKIKALCIGIVVLFLTGLMTVPCFYYVDGRIAVTRPEEIDLSVLENDTAFDKQSVAIIEAGKWRERKSAAEIIGKLIENKENESELNAVAEIKEAAQAENTETNPAEDIGVIYGTNDPKAEHDAKYANQWVGKERGASDEFFQDTENRKIILNFGKGNFDITDCVVKWMYGEPIVNLNKIAAVMGLELSLKKPEGFIKLERSEMYLPEDAPELEYRYQYDVYLLGPDGSSIRYKTGSTIQEDNEHYAYLNTFQVEGDRENNYETLISISEVPYYDGETMKMGVPMSFKYGKEQITITAGDPMESVGYLALGESNKVTKEEYYQIRRDKNYTATDSNAN